jgi:hypothetical protein
MQKPQPLKKLLHTQPESKLEGSPHDSGLENVQP